MSKRAALPTVRSGMASVDVFASMVKQNMDWMTGQHPNAPKLPVLLDTASLADVIVQLNLLAVRLQGD